MKKIFLKIFAAAMLLTASACCKEPEVSDDLVIWFEQPARMWEETLPLGNGRIGAMPDGGVDQEEIVLNDITMWSGSEDDSRNPEALEYLGKIRQLIFEGKNDEAQDLMYSYFSCGGQGSNHGNGADAKYGSFQLMGQLDIQHRFPNAEAGFTQYERGLSLDRALAWTRFEKGGVRYEREYFVSEEDVIVWSEKADRKGSVNFNVSLSRPERYETRSENGMLVMEGVLSNGEEGKAAASGNAYKVMLKVMAKGGRQYVDGKKLVVEGADQAYLLVSGGTRLWKEEYAEEVEEILKEAVSVKYDVLKKAHVEEWQEKFGRVHLDLGTNDNSLPTDKRLIRFQQQEDPAFAALYFQYGRYLMISGTNEDSLPLNLQGLWANTIRTPWNGDYHLNINLQMNYWPMEVTNLSDLHEPLTELIEGLVPSGQVTAKSFYDAEGWVAHMMTNPWKFTAPGEHASWGATNTGGAWLCSHLWEHYAFTLDEEYLEEVYPVMKGAAQFFLSSMIEEPSHGWLVTSPSSSPENAFYLPGTHKVVNVCMGPTMDVQLINELFHNVIRAAQILGKDEAFSAQLSEALKKLPPMQISPKGGYLQEWLEDYEEVDLHHRHVSHLYGLYPSNQISVHETPELAEAARKSLERRGDEGTGWSRAWKINFWARLHDGERAYKLLKNLLTPVAEGGKIVYGGGGTYPNLFCAHPPFQIDGNFGGCAGVAEMLIQSQDGYIELLPAIPAAWSEGSFSGLCVRGAGEVALQWADSRPVQMELQANKVHTFRIKVPDGVKEVKVDGKTVLAEGGFITLDLKKGKRAEIVF